MSSDPRLIPSIDRLRRRAAVRRLEAQYGRAAAVDALREAAAALRTRLTGRAADPPGTRETAGAGPPSSAPPGPFDAIETGADQRLDAVADPPDTAGGGGAPDAPDAPGTPDAAARWIEARLARTLHAALAPSLRPVINATGVILHTNLGRAPLGRPALDLVSAAAGGYANLEYDLATGRRGARTMHAAALLTRLTGAEAAVVVNNNAAAVLLVLAALAAGREVIISRGELVEIGGGFRIPDVLRQSGAVLREVGTTNRTRAADYAAAIGDRTALVLRVHPSNFRIDGFAARPPLADITRVADRFDLPVVEDLGSGLLDASPALAGEPTVRDSVAAGAAVCTFSGDKLLGGPQAGLIVGRRAAIARIRAHPLMRALRVDTLTYAALEATLIEHAAGRAETTVPVARMIAAPEAAIAARAARLRDRLDRRPGLTAAAAVVEATAGGGSTPGLGLPSRAVAVAADGRSPDALAAALRAGDPPVVARIADDRLLLDLRTVDPDQDDALAALVEQAAADAG